RAFKPKVKLESDKHKLYKIWNYVISFPRKIFKYFELFDNHHGKSPLALRIVPLPDFTINRIRKSKSEYGLQKIILNIILFMLIPRWYKYKPRWFAFIPRWFNYKSWKSWWSKIGRSEEDKLSPFSRMILYEDNVDIYDNPA